MREDGKTRIVVGLAAGFLAMAAFISCYSPLAYSPLTLTYNGNGNSGSTVPVDPAKYVIGQTVTVLGNKGDLAKENFIFDGWNTKADGSGSTLPAGADFTMGRSSVTLYAYWVPITNTVSFDPNGGSGSMPPEVMAFGQIGPLSACTFTMTGNTFLGWATSASGLVAYTDGESYTMGASSVTLYAVWKPNTYTVTFDPNSGTGGPMTPQSFVFGTPVSLEANEFSRAGYIFEGWATSAVGAVVYGDSASYTTGPANATLYAFWWPVQAVGVSVAFNVGPYQAFAFSPSSVTLQIGTPLTAATSNATLLSGGTNWLWQLDGATISTQSSLDYDTSGLVPGNHYLDVYVQYNGVLYSGNILVNTTY